MLLRFISSWRLSAAKAVKINLQTPPSVAFTQRPIHVRHKYPGVRSTNVYNIESKIWSDTYYPSRSEEVSTVLLACSRQIPVLCCHGHVE